MNKACILCNGVLTFYSLPELTPAFGNTKVLNCSWVGGVDLDDRGGEGNDEVVMICMKNRIRLVRIGEEARAVKNIEYPSCLGTARRGGFACVADSHAYALLDVAKQQKVPLFPISSIDGAAGSATGGPAEDMSSKPEAPMARSVSSARLRADERAPGAKTHSRSTSLGTFVSTIGRSQPDSRSRSRERQVYETPDPSGRMLSPAQAISPIRHASHSGSPDRRPATPEKPLPPAPDEVVEPKKLPPVPVSQAVLLKPHICSPVPTEFLLTTGTLPDDPGVGIFVNLDGDVVRGTLEFSRYPSALVVDGGNTIAGSTTDKVADDTDGYVLAAIARPTDKGEEGGIEIQRWDVETGTSKEWLDVTAVQAGEDNDHSHDKYSDIHVGLGSTQTSFSMTFPEVGEMLRARRLKLPIASADARTASKGSRDSGELVQPLSSSETATVGGERSGIVGDDPDSEAEVRPEDWEIARNKQEDEYVRRLGESTSHIVVWMGKSIWWAVRNPLAMKLDAAVEQALEMSIESKSGRSLLMSIVNSIRTQEPRTETEFLSLEYIRQKSSLILLASDLNAISTGRYEAHHKITEELLIHGGIDPRVPLSIIPLLQQEVVEGSKGIWIYTGVIQIMQSYISQPLEKSDSGERLQSYEATGLLAMVKRFLMAWRERKGFGSVADETEVFQTVDAALLRLLLYQGQRAFISDTSKSSTLRAELYSVVDHGVNCFDRAVVLLEEYHRLYVLSRLYQSRKMSRNVLATWRRIINGEPDDGGEFVDGENEVRKYLVKIRDPTLVEEYGTWLARRNPLLGVQVFTDDNRRVKLEPGEVVDILRRQAPEAVKVFLEHLVFGKKNIQYANDLISYYLDNVLTVLGSSEEARSILAQSYESYRALHPPKPTYRQFVIDNTIPASWWHDRLRLLELIGGSHGAGFSYDVRSILQRIEPFEQSLVPELIILDGRQGRHQQALRLLTHGLGDYHTAINYCLLGGSSIFHPTAGPLDPQSIPTREEQATLFGYLFSEFLHIEDITDRVERTSELLERFGSWFDVAYVLDRIPDSWSVELLSGFLISAFRRVVQERSEAMIAKSLSGAENLKISADFVEKCEEAGAHAQVV